MTEWRSYAVPVLDYLVRTAPREITSSPGMSVLKALVGHLHQTKIKKNFLKRQRETKMCIAYVSISGDFTSLKINKYINKTPRWEKPIQLQMKLNFEVNNVRS